MRKIMVQTFGRNYNPHRTYPANWAKFRVTHYASDKAEARELVRTLTAQGARIVRVCDMVGNPVSL